MGFDPGFLHPTCLVTLKSSDRTKQSVCGKTKIRSCWRLMRARFHTCFHTLYIKNKKNIYMSLRKTKIRSFLDHKFISILLWVLTWINNSKFKWTSSDPMDIMNTAGMGTGEKGVRSYLLFRPIPVFLSLPVGTITK